MVETPSDEFLSWAKERSIGLDERYSEPRSLVYKPYRNISRFWAIPETPSVWPYFVGCMLDGIGPWTSCALWFRGGRWPELNTPDGVNEEIRAIVLRGVGVPSNFAGAIHFHQGEVNRIFAVVFVQLAFGWCPPDDLFIIPDNARSLLYVSHHDVIHVHFERRGLVRPFTKHMTSNGFHLPTDVPDWTFKRPRWMKNEGTPGGFHATEDDPASE